MAKINNKINPKNNLKNDKCIEDILIERQILGLEKRHSRLLKYFILKQFKL